MDELSPFLARRRKGSVEVTALGPRKLSSSISPVERYLYKWQPPFQIAVRLPTWFELALECTVDRRGLRYFSLPDAAELNRVPFRSGATFATDATSFALVSSIGGHCLLLDRGEEGQEEPITGHEARIVLSHIKHRREYLGRRKRLEQALAVCAGGQTERDQKSVLPCDLGLDPQGRGEPWNVYRLKEAGLQAARESGIANPSPTRILSLGLLEAGKLNPLYCDDREAQSLVRLVLFALPGSTEVVSEEQLSFVAGRVRESLGSRLANTIEEFRDWTEDGKSNIVRFISRPKGCSLSRPQIRRALLELGWRAFLSLGNSIDLQMRTFREALPEPLSGEEQETFEFRFMANRCFGGLPIILLHDPLPFIVDAVRHLARSPDDPDRIAILRRVMYYYSVMIGNRRAADRDYKRRSHQKNRTGGVAKIQAMPDELASDKISSVDQRIFIETAKRLAVQKTLIADVDAADYYAVLVERDEEQHGKSLAILIDCESLGVHEEFSVKHEEFAVVASQVRDEWK